MVWVKKKLVVIKSLESLILKYTYKVLRDSDYLRTKIILLTFEVASLLQLGC